MEEIKNILSPGNPTEHYDLFKLVAKGGYGVVHLGKTREIGELVAVKALRLSTKTNCNLIITEIRVMKTLAHPNIIKYIDSYAILAEVWLIIEYMDGGTLNQFVRNQHPFDEKIIATVGYELIKGLQHIHLLNVIHRDIKSSNVLLNTKGEVKIADFGSSVQITRDEMLPSSVTGSLRWMAPELMRGETYDYSVDIWSLGMRLAEMVEGDVPYTLMNAAQMIYMIGSYKITPIKSPEQTSENLNSFIRQCLEPDPHIRSTVQDLLLAPFLQQAAGCGALVPLITNGLDVTDLLDT